MGKDKSSAVPGDSPRLSSAKDIRTEVLASDLVVGRVLDGGPPNGLKQDLLADPCRDGLLLDRGAIQELGKVPGKRGLATSNLDGSLQGSNVRFIHNHGRYTNRFVSVNKPVCVTGHKEICIVLQMNKTKKKSQGSSKPPRKAIPSSDGMTLGQRLKMAMAYKSGKIGKKYTATALRIEANRLAGATESEPKISQQNISAILRNLSSRSTFTAQLAEACGVRASWLGDGIGEMIQEKKNQ